MNVNTENEHILVCLSSSPSNKNIIFTASKMANALQAQFTALYVQTGARIQSEDKERLDENIRFDCNDTWGKCSIADIRVCTAVQCY